MSKIKVGVIGVGHLGSIHAKIYKEIPNCTLVGVCDTDKDRLESVSKTLQVTGYQDHRELLGKVDAVSVAVPTKFHQKIAYEFLNNKIHTLRCEPLAPTRPSETAKQLWDWRPIHGLFCCCSWCTRSARFP